MKRRLFHLLAAVSLVICVAIAVLWICDQRGLDGVASPDHREKLPQTISVRDTSWLLLSGAGSIGFFRQAMTEPERDASPLESWRLIHFQSYPAPWTITAQTQSGWVFQGRQLFGFMVGDVGNFMFTLGTSEGAPRGLQWRGIVVPCWALVAATLALPMMRAWSAWERHRRARTGRCRKCGYDLRASKERCPESGATLQSSADAAK